MRIIIYFIVCSFILNQELQTFTYRTKFKSFRVGDTHIQINSTHITDSLKSKSNKIITIETTGKKWIDLIYKLRHYSTILINQDNFSLLGVTQKVQQGNYINSYSATVNYDKKNIAYYNLKNLKQKDNTEALLFPIDSLVYDPFGIVYYLQNLELNIGQQYFFTSYSNTTIKPIKLYVLKKEFIKTPYIKTMCYLVVPQSENNESLLKNKGEMKIWYTADSQQMPIKIQQKMKHGIMELVLTNYVEK